MKFFAGLLAWGIIVFCAVFIISSIVGIVKNALLIKRAKADAAKILKEGENKNE